MSKLIQFVKESVEELRFKVTWPTVTDLQKSSVLVLVASLIFALVIGLMDLAFENTMSWFYSAF